jgi:iron-sulfur cluster repair protein YtfE (RIC family)
MALMLSAYYKLRQRDPTEDDMGGPVELFTTDHRRCDSLWAKVEVAADRDDGAAVRESFAPFAAGMERHFRMEEEVLFPAFEDATGMHGGGPTQMMRFEHVQMRGLLTQLAGAVERGATREVLDLGDTLLMLVQQHNAKEEAMLYPMADRALGAEWTALAARLADY